MTLHIANRQRTKKISTQHLRRIATALLVELQVAEANLGITLVRAKEMARINQQFLQHEGSTDVITFDHADAPPPAGAPRIFGELFICVDDAIAQAKQFRTTWQAEVVRYAVHGVLHLLGHDDLQPAARRAMKREENRLVRRLAARFSLAQLSRPVKMRA